MADVTIGRARQALTQIQTLRGGLADAEMILEAAVKAQSAATAQAEEKAVHDRDIERLEKYKATLTKETTGLKAKYDEAKAAHDQELAKLKTERDHVALAIEQQQKQLAQFEQSKKKAEAEYAAKIKKGNEDLAALRKQMSDLGASAAARAQA